jgi:hypothetical protein
MGFTPDLKGVVFAARRSAKKPTHSVQVDAKFMAALAKLERARAAQERTDRSKTRSPRSRDHVDIDLPDTPDRKRPLPPVGRSQPRTGLSAAEIQQMLRAGRSVKTVAAAAKAPLQWVERLAGPVNTERDGVVRLAQRAYMTRPRLGAAGLQLGEAIRRNLEDRRATSDTIDALEESWDARVFSSGKWRVRLRIEHRGKRRSADWDYTKGSRQITPRNRLASQLGWWAPEPAAEEPASDVLLDGEQGAEEVAPTPRRPAKRKPAKRKPAKRKATAKRKSPVKAKAKAKTRSRSRPARRR